MPFTAEQSNAIDMRGSNLLLSAAAGSGKTTVLVERILQLIERDSADVDRMLVVTFTRAAAADMRRKLAQRLRRACDERPTAHLRRQALLLERACISTLHGFCASFLRDHFDAAGVDPSFRVLDAMEDDRLLKETLDEVLEEAYTNEDEALTALTFGRGAKGVRALVERLTGYLGSRPDPEAWISRATGDDEALYEGYLNELLRGARRRLTGAKALLEEAAGIETGQSSYDQAIVADLERIEELLALRDYESLRLATTEFKLSRCRATKGGASEALERVKALRTAAKGLIEKCALNAYPREAALSDLRTQQPQLERLCALAQEARRRLFERKKEIPGLTYDDLEQLTVRALTDPATRRSAQEQFDYVFVDEYQDTSDNQETIVTLIARGDNLFMVGDVKQSIYRFRGAEPGLFIEKYARYQKGEGGALLPLTRNFRSDAGILRFVNDVFERAMTGGDSEIVYDDLSRLNPGREDLPGTADAVEVHLLEEKETQEAEMDEDILEMATGQRQALFIARRIKAMMRDDPTLRYRDFAVLTRARESARDPMLPVFLSEGIPAYVDGAGGYFETPEIHIALSLIQLVANRRSDEALIAVLRNPIVGLTAGALAEIRCRAPEATFCDACRMYAYGAPDEGAAAAHPAEDDELARRLRAFFEKLEGWRARSGAEGLGSLIRRIVDESGFSVYASALPGGLQRCANLELLASIADAFDENVSGSLVRFLQHTQKLRARSDTMSAHTLGENDDVVRLMTIHKSKGLEFKIVFGAQLQKRYADGAREQMQLDPQLGVGFYHFDSQLHTRRRTLAQAAMLDRQARQSAAEELRVLYVMLTRAQERLVLVGSVRDAQARQSAWAAMHDVHSTARSPLDVVMSALTEREQTGAPMNVRLEIHPADALNASGDEREDKEDDAELLFIGETDAQLEERLRWQYPWPDANKVPLKLTVSGMLRELEGSEVQPPALARPQFMQSSAQQLTATERGTAYHRAMQLIDWSDFGDLSEADLAVRIRTQLNAFVEQRLMTPVQRDAVRPGRIAAFLLSPLGLRLRASGEVRREWAFTMRMKLSEALTEGEIADYPDGSFLVQGSIDCCFLEDGAWVLMDYKTDRTDDVEALRRHYRNQLHVYALALERITGNKVSQRVLCLLGQNKIIDV